MNIISQPVYAVINSRLERECRIMLRSYDEEAHSIQIALVSESLHAYAETFVIEPTLSKLTYNKQLEFAARALDVVSVVSIDTENIEIDYERQRNSFVNEKPAAAKPAAKTNQAHGFAIDKSDYEYAMRSAGFADDVVRQRACEFDNVRGVQSC